MANWVSNEITITWKKEKLEELMKPVFESNDVGLFEVIVPIEDQYSQTWAVRNWGTKWDCTREDMTAAIEGDCLTIKTATASAPPVAAMDALLQMMAEDGGEYELMYFDSASQTVGIVVNGADEDFDLSLYGSTEEMKDNVPEVLVDAFDLVNVISFEAGYGR